MARYHIVLFGDPGSNLLIAKIAPKLPVKWTKEAVTLANETCPASDHYPAMIYPNPLHPSKYAVFEHRLDH